MAWMSLPTLHLLKDPLACKPRRQGPVEEWSSWVSGACRLGSLSQGWESLWVVHVRDRHSTGLEEAETRKTAHWSQTTKALEVIVRFWDYLAKLLFTYLMLFMFLNKSWFAHKGWIYLTKEQSKINVIYCCDAKFSAVIIPAFRIMNKINTFITDPKIFNNNIHVIEVLMTNQWS